MSNKTFEAESVEQALEEAAAELGVAASELHYEVEEKASDFWGLGDTTYVVSVTVPEVEPEPAADEVEAAPAQAEPPTPAAADEPPEEAPAPDTTTAAGSFFSFGDADEGQDAPEPTDAATQERVPAVQGPTGDRPGAEASAAEDDPHDAALPVEAKAAAPPAPAADPEEVPREDLTAEAVGILDRVFVAMGFECKAEAKLDGDTMHVAITGEDNQYLLEGRGRGLAALELVLNHSFRAWPNRAHRRVRVDAGDFRSQRDDEIRDIAYQVAHRAKETGTEQQTGELNAYERRIVHLTLADDPNVTTRSLGNGFLKAVNVIPTGDHHRR